MNSVCVIIPIYNIEQYVCDCVTSAQRQSYADISIVLVDDGSTDGSALVCDRVAKHDDRVFVIHKENGGLSSARNAGVEYALNELHSEWLFFLDGDDAIHSLTIGSLLESCLLNKTRIGVTRLQNVYDIPDLDIPVSRGSLVVPTDAFWVKYGVESIVACGKLFHSSLWSNVRFPDGRLHEDEFTTYRVLFQETNIALSDALFYYYRMRSNSITNTSWNIRRLDILDAKKEQIRFFRETDRRYLENDVQQKYVRAISDCIVQLRTSYPGNKKIDLLRSELLIEFGRLNIKSILHVAQNYNTYHILHPFLVNRATWSFIRACYILKTEGLFALLRKVFKHGK